MHKKLSLLRWSLLTPFETTNEKGEVIGFDVDIAKALCEELKATCEFKTQSFDSLIAGLKFKNFDAIISGMDITEARQKQVAFTNAYLENSVSYVAMKGNLHRKQLRMSACKMVQLFNNT